MKAQEAPVLQPILGLLHSRKFILALIGIVVDLLIAYNPDLLPMRDQLITTVSGIIIVLIGGIAAEDAVQKHADGKVEAAKAASTWSAAPIPLNPLNQL